MKFVLRRCSVLILPFAAMLLASCAAPSGSKAADPSAFKLSPANHMFDLEDEGLRKLWQASVGQIAGRSLEDIYCTGSFVVAQATGGEVHFYGASDGVWKAAKIFRRPLVRPPAELGETLFLLVADRLYGFNTSTGDLSKGYNPRFAVSATPVVCGDSLILAGADGNLARVPVMRAEEARLISIEGPIFEQPVLSGDRVFAAAHGDRVIALDVETWSDLWKWRPDEPSRITSGVALLGDVLYVGDDRGFIYALRADVGATSGKTMLDSRIVSQPRIVGGKLLVLTGKPSLVCLEASASLTKLWKYAGPERLLAVSDTIVYVQNADHSVAAVSLHSGEELWNLPLPPDCKVAGHPLRPAFYVANPEGAIVGFAELD